MKLSFGTCILGNGTTARLCSLFLESTPHIIIGQNKDLGALALANIYSNYVNLVPIFPVYNSDLYNKLWSKKNTKHSFLNYFEQGNIIYEFDKIKELINKANINSYVVKCLKMDSSISTKKNIVLAYKLLGNIIFEYECIRLFAKANRHYYLNKSNTRIGFIDNLSPYYEKIAKIKTNNFICDNIDIIDIYKKQITTNTSKIEYNKLISTISLTELVSKIKNPPDIKLISRPAFFCLIKSKSEVYANGVFYDCEISSPIYRVFTISSNMLIVQFAFNYQKTCTKSLLSYLHKLLTQTFEIEFEYRYTINEAYPIETSSESVLKKFKLELESMNIYLLGRYAEWEYLDLHELNFVKIFNNENSINK